MQTQWTEPRIEALKTMWAEGLSCSQIARVFNCGFSRNAIIGKVHRLGLMKRVESNSQTGKPRPRLAMAPKFRRVHDLLAEPAPLPISPMRLEDGSLIGPMQVSNKTCRWPIGDPVTPEFHFCGHAPKAGAPYCEAHCRVAYQPPQKRDQDVGNDDRHSPTGGRRDQYHRPASKTPRYGF